MRQIRRGCFETNSSSMHSFVISKLDFSEEGGEHYTHDEIKRSVWIRDNTLFFDEDCYYGRSPCRMLTTFNEKCEYALANGYNESEIEDIILEVLPEVQSIRFPENTGCDEYKLKGWLSTYDLTLKEFLTNRRYIIIQDGDEYCFWHQLRKSGLLNDEMFEEGEYEDD